MKWLAVCLVLLLPGFARAQTAGATGCIATLSVSTTAILGSTATVGPTQTGCTWPTGNQFLGYVWVLNESASNGNLYVCPTGDTPANPCSTTNGLELIPGRSWGFYQPSSQMKVIGASTAKAQFQW